MPQDNGTKRNKPAHKLDRSNVAVSLEAQVVAAERRRQLALSRYNLHVKRSGRWAVGPRSAKHAVR